MNTNIDEVVSFDIILPKVPVYGKAQIGNRAIKSSVTLTPSNGQLIESTKPQIINMNSFVSCYVVEIVEMPGGIKGIAVSEQKKKRQE